MEARKWLLLSVLNLISVEEMTNVYLTNLIVKKSYIKAILETEIGSIQQNGD